MAKKEKETEEKFSYDEALAQIEGIVAKLESRETATGFDDMIADVDKALGLIKKCKATIADAEAKLNNLTKSDEE